jgi:hypothetical protein
MRRSPLARALLLLALACLLAAPALAAPQRGTDRAAQRAAGDRPTWTDTVQETVQSVLDWLHVTIGGGPPTDNDRTPGSGLDPDGQATKARLE